MKIILSIFTFLFLISQTNLLNAQYQLGEKWVARYNALNNTVDKAYDVAVDASGNVYITGPSNLDWATVKYNSAGVQQWVQRYHGSITTGTNIPYAIAVDASGNVYVTGYADNNNTGHDCATIKYNTSGVQQWVETYNLTSNYSDCGTDIVVDTYGNVYVCGYAWDERYTLTLMYNSSGAQQWAGTYGSASNPNHYEARCLVYINGYVIISGFGGSSSTNHNYLTIEYSGSGAQMWVAGYNGPGNQNDVVNAIGIDGSGNIYVTGYSNGGGTGMDYATIKYNSAGAQQWVNTFNYLSWDDFAYDIAVEPGGNVYVTGWGKVNSTQGNIVTIKISSGGVYQWGHAYNGPGNADDCGYSLVLDNNGSIYAAGSSVGSSSGIDCVLLRYSTSGGSPLTEKRYNGPGNGEDVTYKIAADANGCLYTTGYSMGSTTNFDFCTIKYVPLPIAPTLVYPANNSTGISLTPLMNWNDVVNADSYTLQVSTNSGFSSFVINQSGLTTSQYQVPASTFQNNILYYWRACAVNTAGVGPWSTVWNFRTLIVGTRPISTEIPKDYKLYYNYPNPFNPSTKIRFDIPKSEFVIIRIFDALGREVATLLNEQLKPGTYEAEFNGADYPSGVYFYKLIARDFVETKKMIMLK